MKVIGEENVEHGPPDVGDHRVDLLQSRLSGEILERDPLALEIRLDRLPVLDEHHGASLERRSQPREAVVEPREEHRQQADGHRGQERARDGEVLLRHALLNKIADHDEHDQVERLHAR